MHFWGIELPALELETFCIHCSAFMGKVKENPKLKYAVVCWERANKLFASSSWVNGRNFVVISQSHFLSPMKLVRRRWMDVENETRRKYTWKSQIKWNLLTLAKSFSTRLLTWFLELVSSILTRWMDLITTTVDGLSTSPLWDLCSFLKRALSNFFVCADEGLILLGHSGGLW